MTNIIDNSNCIPVVINITKKIDHRLMIIIIIIILISTRIMVISIMQTVNVIKIQIVTKLA